MVRAMTSMPGPHENIQQAEFTVTKRCKRSTKLRTLRLVFSTAAAIAVTKRCKRSVLRRRTPLPSPGDVWLEVPLWRPRVLARLVGQLRVFAGEVHFIPSALPRTGWDRKESPRWANGQ
jgi:hypothetical protein